MFNMKRIIAVRKVAVFVLALSLLFSLSKWESFAQSGHHASMMEASVDLTQDADKTDHLNVSAEFDDVSQNATACEQSSDNGSSSQFGKGCCKMACAGFVAVAHENQNFQAFSVSEQLLTTLSFELLSIEGSGLRRPPRA